MYKILIENKNLGISFNQEMSFQSESELNEWIGKQAQVWNVSPSVLRESMKVEKLDLLLG